PYWTYPSGQFSQVFEDSSYRILKNTKAYPHAFLAGSYQVAHGQEILQTMFDKKIDLLRSVVLEQNPALAIRNDPKAISKIVSYKADKITITTQAKTNMLLFLSDSYYPGWKAYIDGKEMPILRADYAFRAIPVPKGVHTVIFAYKPLSFALGLIGAIVGLVSLVGVSFFVKKGYFQN
ncbi:MAG TPA: YfhO family protein, partial [Candidatus Saccharimonadales bacterium]|nr:YfhO family protein [Candidatus Saccharimonadales bacterium]